MMTNTRTLQEQKRLDGTEKTPMSGTNSVPYREESRSSGESGGKGLADRERTEWRSTKLRAKNMDLYFGDHHVLKGINMEIPEKSVTAIIGPSGCGKTTFLRALNRMHDFTDSCKLEGKVFLDDVDIYSKGLNPVFLRTRIGMVFQKPNPFPTMSIRDNILFAPRRLGLVRTRKDADGLVEVSLKRAALWDEVKDRLDSSAISLSGGQQQRLCIARALAIKPEVILMDEPCSALDPIATGKIEDLIVDLKKDYTVVIVTHNMQQAARVSDWTAYFYLGEIIEFDRTSKIFENPKDERTEAYVTGRFG
jgi:phosphate transport system ATP-binding protein